MAAEDEGVRALYEPRESTSVWRAHADPETAVVATLTQMGDVGIPTRNYDTDAEIVDPARYSASGMVQIQIVKRNGKFVAVVDGLVPPTQTDADGKVVHLINHHRGMHEDLETKTWIFSPCAVSVCVEDGQPSPERSVVSVWQHVSIANTPALTSTSSLDPIKLGERLVKPFEVSAYVASVVYVPLPMRYSQQPRVVIADLSALLRFDERQSKKALWHFYETSMPYVVGLMAKWSRSVYTDEVWKELQKIVWIPGWIDSAATKVAHAFPRVAEFFYTTPPEEVAEEAYSWMGMGAWFNPTPQSEEPEQPEGINLAEVFMANIGSVMAAVGYIAIKICAPGAAAIAGAFGEDMLFKMKDPKFTLGDPESAELFKKYATNLLGNRLQLATYLYKGLKGYIEREKRPEPIRRYFTIGELATVIESLGSILPTNRDQLYSTTGKRKYASEAVVLQWLVASDTNWPFMKALFKTDLPSFSHTNKIDMSEFDDLSKAAIEMRVHIDIEDPTSRIDCNGERTHFEFATTRQDKDYAGFAAAGVAHDIRRLQKAITKFEQVLETESRKLTWSDRYNTFIDRWIYDPLFSVAMQAWKYQSRKLVNREMPGYDGEVLLMLQRYRAYTFRFIRKHLNEKLKARFVYPSSEGQVLLRKIEMATRERFLKAQLPPMVLRELPQKIQEPTFLFPLSKNANSDYVDVEIESGTMREFSPLFDAIQAASRAAQSARTAIMPMHRKWETEGQRCLFVHAVQGMTDSQWQLKAQTYALAPPQEAYSLVLQLPGDIRAAEATVRLVEETERRIRTLCHKGAAASETKTLLEHLKLLDTEAGLVAMSLLAELWTDELLRLHARPEPTRSIITAVQTAQARAASRCVACGELLRATTTKDWAGFLPMDGDDPAFVATQAGRDAARLARRLQLAAQPVTSRGVLSRAMVLRLRAIAKALIVTGNRLADKPDSQVLPSEPLQALFTAPVHGVRAFARAAAFPTLDRRVVAAMAGAYPSSLLLTDAQAANPDAIEPFGEPLKPPPVPENVARKVRERMAALRFDYPATVHLDASSEALHASDADLTVAMNRLALTNESNSVAFYVPYGHGQAPPRLVYPPVPAPMFGSVPVWISDVLVSINDLRDSLQTTTPTTGAHIWPTFTCDGSVLYTAHPDPGRLPAHPAIIKVDVADLSTINLRFWASEPELEWSPEVATFTNANAAAKAHVQTEMERKLSSRVSTLAWNAERTMQCLLALSGQEGVSLMLSNGDARVAVRRPSESASARQARLVREVEEARYDAESNANLHFAELRLMMTRIEAYIENPAQFVFQAEDDAAPAAAPAAASTQGAPLDATDLAQVVLPGDEAGLQTHDELDTQVSLPSPSTLLKVNAGIAAAQYGYAFLYWLNPAAAATVSAALAGITGAGTAAYYANKFRKRRATVNQARARYGSKSTSGLRAVKASRADCELPLARSTTDYNDENIPKAYVQELAQLRNPAISTVAELRRTDCPPDEPEAWELWRTNAELIEQRALLTFLSDDFLALNLKSKAPYFEPDDKFASNPSSKRRKDVYQKIIDAYAIFDKDAEYDGRQINAGLEYYRSLINLSAERYYARRDALAAHAQEVATEEARRATAQRHVRMHTVAAAVVGAALARGALGAGAPKLAGVLGPLSMDALDDDERAEVEKTLKALSAKLEGPVAATQTTAGRPTALRLGELCAITQSVLK